MIKPSLVCRLTIQSNLFVPDRSLKIIALHSPEPEFSVEFPNICETFLNCNQDKWKIASDEMQGITSDKLLGVCE